MHRELWKAWNRICLYHLGYVLWLIFGLFLGLFLVIKLLLTFEILAPAELLCLLQSNMICKDFSSCIFGMKVVGDKVLAKLLSQEGALQCGNGLTEACRKRMLTTAL